MAKTLKGRTQNPAYTAAVLKAKNPVLLKGEIVYESDTTRHKIGNGTTAWNALPYAKGDFDGPLAAEKVTQDATHRFVSDTEKTAWNGKAAKDLSNVTLTKLFSDNGYYKAPDGLLIQWGYASGGGSLTVYFPISFYTTPYNVLAAVVFGNRTAVATASVNSKTASSFTVRKSYIESTSGGVNPAGEPIYWFAIGRWK